VLAEGADEEYGEAVMDGGWTELGFVAARPDVGRSFLPQLNQLGLGRLTPPVLQPAADIAARLRRIAPVSVQREIEVRIAHAPFKNSLRRGAGPCRWTAILFPEDHVDT
jgi:hypothetical protein